MKKKTIGKPFRLTGIGIHSGKESSLIISPAPSNTGICFIKEGRKIPALVEFVKQTNRGTTLAGIAVVEHFLSAVFALGIDNLLVEVKGDELPAMDGSALPYAQALMSAGLTEQEEEKKFFVLSRPIKITHEDVSLEALPCHGFKVDFMVNFPPAGEQKLSFDLQKGDYTKEIAPARTFGFVEEHEMLKEQGLALGATFDNALVLSRDGYVNKARFTDEVVRHKILDLIGDLSLLGRPLQAKIKAIKSGHGLNIKLVRRLLEYDGTEH